MEHRRRLTYFFDEVTHCATCGDDARAHEVLGQRLNRSQGYNPRRKDGISVSVKRCSQCGLVYASPQPVPVNIQDHYDLSPEAYWGGESFSVPSDYFGNQIATAKELLSFTPGMKALDIGAGIGKGMIALQRAGFESHGLEASESFHEVAITRMNVDPSRLIRATIEDAHYADGYFDFVSFGAVLEHLYDPAASVAKALAWMKPRGIMHIEVPSSRYLISKGLNVYYRLRGTNFVTNISPMHQPFHLYEFDVRSFERLGERVGFRIERYKHQAWEIMEIPRPLRAALTKCMEWTGTGMQLSVWLRKK